MTLPYDISYCFNDQGGFNGKPVYPTGSMIPIANIVPVIPSPGPTLISDINSHNQRLDDAKHRLGELWLPTYLPQNYVFTGIGTSTPTSTTTTSELVFGFVQGGLEINITVKPVDSLTHEELIKIAESFVEY